MSEANMKSMTILYEVKNGLYVNLTNKCNCNCSFCIRKNADCVYEETDPLWLEHEPTFEEVKAALLKKDLSKYEEIIFCGYGEPTAALDVLLETSKFIKTISTIPIRLNTNGLGNLYNKKNIEPLFYGLIDTVSISLNAPSKIRYNEIVHPIDKEKAFDSMIDFTKVCKKYVNKIILTTVATFLTNAEEEQCRKLCNELNVEYRIREYSAPKENK